MLPAIPVTEKVAPQPPTLLLVGQTPPPWHGQAVGTKILFDHDWPGLRVQTLRMAYSDEMEDVGRLAPRKILHLFSLIRRTRRFLKHNPGTALFYPPTSPHWIPFLRDVVYLWCVRRLASRTIFLFHAGGFADFVNRSRLARWLSSAYRNPDLCLEVAVETPAPHQVLGCANWSWTPYGVAVPEVAPRQDPIGRPLRVLFVGSLQEGKGVLEVIHTAAALRERGRLEEFRFSLVGRWFSDAFRDQATRLVRELGLEDFINFPGQKTGDEKWEEYAKADIFFFPSHYASEAFPFVVLEALGSGLPVLSTDWRGIPSIVEGSGVAWLRPVRAPERYADALGEIAAALRSGKPLASRAREFYGARYQPQHFIQRVSQVLYPLLGLPELPELPEHEAAGNRASGRAPARPLRVMQVFNQYLERGGEEEWVDQMLKVSAPTIEMSTLRFQSRTWTEKGRPNRLRQVFLIRDNPVSRRQLRSEVERSRPEALIFHNVLPVGSLGLYEEAASLGIPVFQYIHNFRPFSPSGTMWFRDRVHSDALAGSVWPEILHAAWEGSVPRTALLAWHLRHFVNTGGLERIHHWIAVSDFMRSKFIDAGIPASKITTIRHCWHPGNDAPQPGEGDYYLFLGRIVAEKGIDTLIASWRILQQRLGTGCPRLIIAGTGPGEARVHRDTSDSEHIDFIGFVTGNAKQQLISRARALIVPSIWWEPLGLTVYDAYEHRRPVLAAASGGLTETVRHAVTGYFHEPGNPAELADSIIRMENDGPEIRREMGAKGRRWLEEEADPAAWRAKLFGLLSGHRHST